MPGIIDAKKSVITAGSTRVYAPSKQQHFTPNQCLVRLSNALQTISRLSANVVQKNPNGTQMTAKLYLERPGKMRLVYNPPCTIQMIANNRVLAYYDGQRRKQSMPLSQSPVAFLLTGKLEEQVDLRGVVQNGALITLDLAIKKDRNATRIHMTFNINTLLKSPHLCPLTGWTLFDAYGKATHITLSGIVKNGTIAKDAFEWPK